MQSHLARASLFVTDASVEERPKAPAGCSVIYFDASRTALGAWYAAAGLAGFMRGWDCKDDVPQMPFQVPDLVTSYSLCASMAAALFHQTRLGRDAAQLVQSDFFKSSLYQGMVPVSLMQAAPDYAFGFNSANCMTFQDQLDCNPVPSFQPIRLRDGKWVLMLGVDLKKDLPKLLKNLGIFKQTMFQVVCRLPAVICACDERKKNKLLRLRPIFQLMNRSVRQAFEKMDSKEFSAWSVQTKTYNYVIMPELDDLMSSEHCAALKCFERGTSGVTVKQPVKIVF